MTQNEIIDLYIKTYSELTKSHMTEGRVGAGDPEEIYTINAGIATTLTINELVKGGTN